MPKVVFVNEKREIEVPAGANLRQELLKNAVPVYPGMSKYLNCLGHGTCGTCQVLVKKGKENLSPKTFFERVTLFRLLSSIGQEDELRLACQCTVKGDIEIVTTPGFNWHGEKFWAREYPNK